jgi:hypothetical protein
MTDDLKLPQVGELTLPRWQYWLARYNEVLSEKSGRIERLEAALIDILKVPRSEASWGIALVIAHHALKEGKDE